MNEPATPAADLVLVDIANPDQLATWVARHTIAPARRMLGMPAPSPAEGEEAPAAPSFSSDDSPAHFGPVISGLLIWSTLFPHVAPTFGELDTLRRNPSIAWQDGGFTLALWTGYGQVRRQVDGLFGPETTPEEERRRWDVRYHDEPRRNAAALDELRRMQQLLLRLYGDPDEWEDLVVRYETGLRHVDLEAAAELDAILHRDVHRRLVRVGTDEPILPGEMPDGEGRMLRVDAGVFAASVPETLSGALALDFADGLESHRRVARCAGCKLAVVISNQQAARVAKRQPVYHPECKDEARLAYFRAYQRTRRGLAAV